MNTVMKAPFQMYNIAPGITTIKYVGNSSGHFNKNSTYPVRKVNANSILTLDEYGKDHTLSLGFLNSWCELINPDPGIDSLQEILAQKIALKDLKGMDEVYARLRKGVESTIPKVEVGDIWDGAYFQNDEFYLTIVEFPQQGFSYIRTKKTQRKWELSSGVLWKEEVATNLNRLNYERIKQIPNL